MAARAFTMRIPQLVHGGAWSMGYPTFVSATFHANGQNKRLMVKEVVDKAWVVSVKSHKHMLDDDKVSGLSKQPSMRMYDAMWEKYQPGKVSIQKPSPSGAGTTRYFEINETKIVVPLHPFMKIDTFDYIHFAKRLSRDNPRVKLDQKMTDKAWDETIATFQKLGRAGIPSKGIREARNRAKSRAALQYWKGRELEDQKLELPYVL